jgi:hypothetical protein
MGMGFGANYADVMEWSQIKRIVPREARAMERALKKAGVSMDNFCQAVCREHWDYAEIKLDDQEAAIRQMTAAWETLSTAFTSTTKGLVLEVRFHDADNDGDRYDDVSGGFFHVEGLYQLTSAGKNFADKIERKFYVTFG